MTTTNYEEPHPETTPSVPYAKLIVQGRIVKIAVSKQYLVGDSWPLSPRQNAVRKRLRALLDLKPQRAMAVLPNSSETSEFELEEDIVMDDAEIEDVFILEDEDEPCGPKRDIVVGLSDASRRRLLRRTGIIDPHGSFLAVTLTYPDIFPVQSAIWHRHLEAFRKALKRKFGPFGAVWRIEFDIRQQGLCVDWCAPHFHFAIHFQKHKERRDLQRHKGEIIQWHQETWYSLVGSGEDRHLNAGSQVRVAHNVQGWLTYLTKRDRVNVADYYPDGTGRVWGIWYGRHIPEAPKHERGLSPQEYWFLFYRLRNQLGAAKENLRSSHALTCIVNEEHQKKLLHLPPMTGEK